MGRAAVTRLLQEVGTAPGAPIGTQRLLGPHGGRHERTGLADHLDRFGDPPPSRFAFERLTEVVERSGLTGRGGAAFPTARKLEAVRRRRGRAVVVVNGMEGEPASAKDGHLLAFTPHLVLDGAALAATAVGADAVLVAVRRDRVGALHSLGRALAERRQAGTDLIEPCIHDAPARYVGGEESALVHWLNGGPIRPVTVPPRPYERGVDGRATLVLNVETLAHLALIARYGDTWFRTVGRPDAPGTALLTVSGSVASAGVTEVALGSSLEAVVAASRPSTQPGMLLAGGYFGGWIPWESCGPLAVAPADLQAAGGGLGAGILIVAPIGACPLIETARIVTYLARESARQCGPCLNGVAAVARDLAQLCTADASARVTTRLRSRIGTIDRRGACALPDGVRRLVASALDGFPDHVAAHERFGPCREAPRLALPLPATPASEADWR